MPQSRCQSQTGRKCLKLHELLCVHDSIDQEVHQGRTASVLIGAKYGEVGLNECCSSIGRHESSGKLTKQQKSLVKATTPPFIELHHIGLEIDDALGHELPTDAPAELLMFAFKGFNVLCCELALKAGSHPYNKGDKLVLPNLS